MIFAETYANSDVIGWPSDNLLGRPVMSWISVAGSMPKRQKIVAARSDGVTGSLAGKAPMLSLAPKTEPPLIPPPANSTV